MPFLLAPDLIVLAATQGLSLMLGGQCAGGHPGGGYLGRVCYISEVVSLWLVPSARAALLTPRLPNCT